MMNAAENSGKRISALRQSGIPFGIISAIAFGTSPYFAKKLFLSGFDLDSVLFVRFLPAVIVLGVLTVIRRQGFLLSRHECLQCFVAGTLFCATSFLLFLSYQNMDIGLAATLLFLYPIFVVLISASLFRERLTWKTGIVLLFAFSGVALLSISGAVTNVSMTGILLALLSAVSYAGFQVWIARSATNKIPAVKLTFYLSLLCLIFYFIRIQFGTAFHGEFTWSAAGNIAGVSMIGALIAMAMSAISLQRCGATVTSVLGALEPFTAVILGIVIFHETVTLQKLFGTLIVIAAVVFIIIQRGKSRAPSFPVRE